MAPASIVVRRGARQATTSIEGLVLAGEISHPPAEMGPLVSTHDLISASGWLMSPASIDLYYWRLALGPTSTVNM